MRRNWGLLAVVGVALVMLPPGRADIQSGTLYWSFESVLASSDHPDAVACPSLDLCLVVDRAGNVFSSGDARTGQPTWSKVNVDGTNDLSAISCPSASFCAAVDGAGNVLTSTDPGGGAAAWTAIPADTAPLTGVSCVSASFCAAVDQNGYVLTSTDPTNPLGWSNIVHADGTHALNGVSCASTALCVAVDNAGNILTSTAPTSGTWQSAYVEVFSNDILSVECPSASLCLAGAPDEILNSTNPTGGVAAWNHLTVNASIDSLSCFSTGFCTGVDTSGEFWWSTDPFESFYTWSSSQINPGSLTGVSCYSTIVCVAVAPTDKDGGSAGYALAAIQAPTVTTGVGTATSTTTATLTGTVNPNDALVSSCVFAYGTTISYTSFVPCAESPGEGSGDVTVSAQISGLSPNTTYHFQLRAYNHNFGKLGADEIFTTVVPPQTLPLTVSTAGAGSGRVTSVPGGIDCGATCTHSFSQGTMVTLTATAASGSVFGAWSGACTGLATCTVTMSAAEAVTATFDRRPTPPPPKCVVPKLKGKTLAAAKRAIKSHHCSVGTVHRATSRTVKKGHVISQKPRPGARRRHGAKVKLVLSKGRR
jgi:PASTA domain-containing protein/List-Bact-rpt repeat protein